MIDKLFTRDNILWTFGLIVAGLAFIAAHTSLCPVAYQETVKDLAGLLGVLSAYIKSSPAPHSDTL